MDIASAVESGWAGWSGRWSTGRPELSKLLAQLSASSGPVRGNVVA